MSEVNRFDVVVVGGGPAGIAAACSATRGTSSVALIDEGVAAGGQIWRRDHGGAHPTRAEAWLRRLRETPVTVLSQTSVVDAQVVDGRYRFLIESHGRPAAVESATVILATGARELFMPFPGWTLPGVLGVGGAQAMMKGGMAVRGKRVVVAGSGPLLMAVAASLAAHDADVVAVVEQASLARMLRFGASLAFNPRAALDALTYAQRLTGGVMRFGSWVSAARGRDRLERVIISDSRNEAPVECDLLCTGFGLVPNTELAALLGCATSDGGIEVDALQRTSLNGVFAAGECTRVGGVDAALIEGAIAGQVAVGIEPGGMEIYRRTSARRWSDKLDVAFALRPEILELASPHTIICRCEDVRRDAIDPSWSARQAKLYTRVGMGPCQGRVCGPATRRLFGWDADAIRSPLQPVSLSTLVAQRAPASSGAS